MPKNRRLFSIVLPFQVNFIVPFLGFITKTRKLLCVTDNQLDIWGMGGGGEEGYYHCGQPWTREGGGV